MVKSYSNKVISSPLEGNVLTTYSLPLVLPCPTHRWLASLSLYLYNSQRDSGTCLGYDLSGSLSLSLSVKAIALLNGYWASLKVPSRLLLLFLLTHLITQAYLPCQTYIYCIRLFAQVHAYKYCLHTVEIAHFNLPFHSHNIQLHINSMPIISC